MAEQRITDRDLAAIGDPDIQKQISNEFADPVVLVRNLASAFQAFLNSSLARRKDRTLQREMLNDPDITASLDQSALSIANLDYQVSPQDEGDPVQVAQANAIENHFKRIPGFTQMLHRLQYNSKWYGPGVEEAVWAYVKPVKGIEKTDAGEEIEAYVKVAPVRFLNIHSDSIVWTLEGEPALMVSHKAKYPGARFISAHYGTAMVIPDDLRARYIIHTYNTQAGDYEDPYSADQFYRGKGLRDELYWYWWFKNNALQLVLNWIERYAVGIRVGYYEAGNESQKNAMFEAMRNASSDTSLLMPRTSDGNGPSFEILNAPGEGAQFMLSIVQEYFASAISQRIVGQKLTMNAEATGLGSGVAEQHAATYNRIVRFDAKSMAERLTQDLVRPMHVLNFGDTPYLPRFEFPIPKTDPAKQAALAQTLGNLGVTFSARQLRDLGGWTKPEADDEIVGGRVDPFGPDTLEGAGGAALAKSEIKRMLTE